ncbi:MAG TPA: MerR family transcriptional regulator [Dehalococcoidia bacterium]|nr:MerR family transcriptional regulator [Dehalococcoidia bacterium]
MGHKRQASASDTPPPEQAYLQIGEVADRTGVTQRTLRFYEEKGLLKPPSRLEGGFRLYSEDDVRRVEQIKQLQTLLGFTLAEIKEMVDSHEVRMQVKASYRKGAEISERRAKLLKAKEMTLKQIAVIDQKLAAMHEMKAELARKIDQYDAWLQNLEEQSRAGSR